MDTECEGLVIRETRILKGRRMILLFTDRFGMISAGTSVSERGKNRSALAIRRFTRGVYQLRRNRGSTSIIGGDILHSYYDLSLDYDKFASASLALEFTVKILPEEVPSPKIYELLVTFLEMLEKRKKSFDTLTAAYFVKVLKLSGVFPDAENFEYDELLSELDFGIVRILVYLAESPLGQLEKLALDEELAARLLRFVIRYSEYHLDIGVLKSDLPKE